MGYCSTLMVIRRHERKDENGNVLEVFGHKMAEFDLEARGNVDFHNKDSKVFTKPIDFDLYITERVKEISFNSDTDITTAEIRETTRKDRYGVICKYASVEDSFDLLLKEYSEYGNEMLWGVMSYLKVFLNQPDIVVVHYGH